MEFAQLLDLTTNVVFPAGVCVYLLWERKTHQDKTNEILNNLSVNIKENTTILNQLFNVITKEK